jgi:hypothetical protein
MVKGYRRIDARADVFELFEQCEVEYRRHHPEFEGMPLSRSKILRQVCRHYLGMPP